MSYTLSPSVPSEAILELKSIKVIMKKPDTLKTLSISSYSLASAFVCIKKALCDIALIVKAGHAKWYIKEKSSNMHASEFGWD